MKKASPKVPRLVGFQAEHPEITLRVTTLYAPVDFGQDGVDVELRYGPGNWPGVKAYKLADETYFPVASPAYLREAPPLRSPADLMRHRLIHVLGEREGWGAFLRHFSIADPPVSEGLQCDSQIVALQACMAGGGVMLATSPHVDPLLKAGHLAAPLAARLPTRHAHYLVLPKGPAPARDIAKVVEWLLSDRAANLT